MKLKLTAAMALAMLSLSAQADCAYPKALFAGAGDAAPLAAVCGAHSVVLG